MSIRLTPDEAWARLAATHTGILTTLRSDGRPVTLPVWFVVDARSVCLSTPPGSKKVLRVRHDPRASFLIESGSIWRELFGVHLGGHVEEVSDEADRVRIKAALDSKYARSKVAPAAMTANARAAYASYTILRLVPEERVLSWDNQRIQLGPPE